MPVPIADTLQRIRQHLADGKNALAISAGEAINNWHGCPAYNGYRCPGRGDFRDDDAPITHAPAYCWVATANEDGGE